MNDFILNPNALSKLVDSGLEVGLELGHHQRTLLNRALDWAKVEMAYGLRRSIMLDLYYGSLLTQEVRDVIVGLNDGAAEPEEDIWL